MNFMLDTNICIALIKQKPETMIRRLQSHALGDVGISAITLAELRYGVEKSRFVEKNRQSLDEFLLPLEIAEFDERAAGTYGQLRALLEGRGLPIGPLDTLIGSHALSLAAVLVTNNTREFRRIRGLRVENWIT